MNTGIVSIEFTFPTSKSLANYNFHMTTARLVLSTAASREEAQKLAQTLVHEQVAACVNVLGPISSTYRWKSNIENAEEFLLIIKTTAERFAAVRDVLLQHHSYELPECISVAIDEGSSEYLKWIAGNVL